MLTSRSFAEITHHVRFDIGGKYFAFRDALCNPHAEIPGGRADIGDQRSASLGSAADFPPPGIETNP